MHLPRPNLFRAREMSVPKVEHVRRAAAVFQSLDAIAV